MSKNLDRIQFNRLSTFILQKPFSNKIIKEGNVAHNSKKLAEIRRSTSIKLDNKFHPNLNSSYFLNDFNEISKAHIQKKFLFKSSNTVHKTNLPNKSKYKQNQMLTTRIQISNNPSNSQDNSLSNEARRNKGNFSTSISTIRNEKIFLENSSVSDDKNLLEIRNLPLKIQSKENDSFDIDGIHFEVNLKKNGTSANGTLHLKDKMKKEMSLQLYDFNGSRRKGNCKIISPKTLEKEINMKNLECNIESEFPSLPINKSNENFTEQSNQCWKVSLKTALQKINQKALNINKKNPPLTPITNISFIT